MVFAVDLAAHSQLCIPLLSLTLRFRSDEHRSVDSFVNSCWLTNMSTVLAILQHEQPGGRLCRFLPRFRGREREVRMLTVERGDIHDWLYAEAVDEDLMEAKGHARGHFGQFVRGERIDDLDFMKRVEDRRRSPWSMEHGVWAISPRFRPQYRFFGVFATRNWFVVLTKHSRNALQEDNSWHAQIDRSLTLWRELFPGKLQHVVETLPEFMSNAEKCDDRW